MTISGRRDYLENATDPVSLQAPWGESHCREDTNEGIGMRPCRSRKRETPPSMSLWEESEMT